MNKAVIFGAGSHARPIISTLKLQGIYELIGIIDTNFDGSDESILGVPVLGGTDKLKELSPKDIIFFIAIGDNKKRKSSYDLLFEDGYQMPNLIHPNAYISLSTKLGKGNYIGPFSHLGPEACIGNANILNTFSNIEHEVVISDFTHCAPNSTVCGRSSLASGVFLGTGATIIDKIFIAEDTLIAAGSVIVKSIKEPNCSYAGIPGKKI